MVITTNDITIDKITTNGTLPRRSICLKLGYLKLDTINSPATAVNNAVKHAEATKISVDFTINNNILEVSISDNGKGFDKEIIEAGNGLASMKKRAQEIDADFSIKSLKQGTNVTLKFILD